jgi:hypothetical protein
LHDQDAVLIGRFDMPSARASIAELLRSGTTLTVSEAVAIARAALAFDPARATDSKAPSGQPLPDTIFIEADGSIVGLHAAPPATSEVALLLQGLLPPGSPGVPGGLRYAIARALGEVDAPPFASPEDFSIILSRFQTVDGPAVAHGILAHINAGTTPKARETVERRRPNGATVTSLRRALREADSQLYEWQRSPDVKVATWPRARKAMAIAASLAAGVLLFVAGVATRDRIGTAPATTEAARAVPAAADIVLEAPPRKAAARARVREQKPKARAASAAPATRAKNRGVFARLHLQWLKKAFS